MEQYCRSVKEEIQNFLDSGKEISRNAAGHLRNCASCRSFFAICKGYPDNLKDALNREAERLEDPDFSGLKKLSLTENPFRQRRVRRIVTWAVAALLVFGFGSTFGYRGYSLLQAKSFIRKENSLFVEKLISASLLSTENGQMISESGWFQGTESLSDMLSGSPLFSSPD
jgi:hypothetical protein